MRQTVAVGVIKSVNFKDVTGKVTKAAEKAQKNQEVVSTATSFRVCVSV